ncbi:MAG: hypothetical protein ACOCWR_08830 [Oceanidesulfovibrio sp.]
MGSAAKPSARTTYGDARRPALWAIALISAGAISLEISYIRLFSAALGHDLASMVISLALLGVGAAGSALALAGERATERATTVLPVAALGFALTGCLCAAWGLTWEVVPQAFSWEPLRLAKLAGLYVLLAVPFVFSGGAIGLSLAAFRQSVGTIYRADLLGAGVGGCAALAGSYWLDPGHGVIIAGIVGLAAAFMFSTRGGWRWMPLTTLSLAIAGLVIVLAFPSLRPQPRFSTYRDLGRALLAPEAGVVWSAWDPLGLVTAVRSPRIPVRFAPGLSLTCADPVPEQLALYQDGGGHGAITRMDDSAPGFVRCLPTGAPFRLRPEARVLVLNNAGGLPVLEALAGGAAHVDAVEPLIRLHGALHNELARFAGNLYNRADVRLVRGNAREYVEKSSEQYDVIRVNFRGPAGTGLSVGEDYLRTREGMAAVLGRLAPGGVLTLSRPMEALPSASIRLISLMVEALEAHGLPEGASVGDCLAIVRGPFTVTILARATPFTSDELTILRGFADQLGLDMVWLPGMRPDEANRRNVLDAPHYHNAARELLGPERDAFIAGYPYDISAPRDDRPYFAALFRWESARGLYAERLRGSMGLIQWSYLLIPVTLAQAAFAGVLFILSPLAVARASDRMEKARLGLGRAARFTGYFVALGLGFMMLEILAIKRLTLFMGGPVQATAAVLGPFLVFSGVGAGWAQRWVDSSPQRIRQVLAVAILAAAVAALFLFSMADRMHEWMGLHTAAKAVVTAVLVAPLALCLGFPFPLGLALVSRRAPRWAAWAFGVNGCASVAGPIAAQLVAVEAGFGWVALLGMGLYPLAWCCLLGEKHENRGKRRSRAR